MLKVGQQDGWSVSLLEMWLVKVSTLNQMDHLPVFSVWYL